LVAAARNRIRFATLLGALVLVIAAPPLLGGYLLGLPLTRLTFSVLFFAGVYAVSRNRRVLVGGSVIGLFAFLSTWLATESEAVSIVIADHATDLAFIAFVGATILRTVVAHDEITSDTIYGGICVYLLIGLGWEAAYSIVEYLNPGSFAMGGVPLSALDTGETGPRSYPALVYYSFVTLTTLGYGDIVPTTPQARVLSTAEAVFGQLFVAIFIARLVGLQLAQARGGGEERGQTPDS
jgi:hypothetical protein